ncbi:unnamed protein product [Urochloa humidicola]
MPVVTEPERTILRQADARLNKEPSNHLGRRPSARGPSCFSIPLKKSLLCAPPPKPKQGIPKKILSTDHGASGHRDRGHAGENAIALPNLPVDEEATALLMRATGVLGPGEQPSDLTKQKFGETFVCPLVSGCVGKVRNVLGLPESGGAGRLAPLVAEAEDPNDD